MHRRAKYTFQRHQNFPAPYAYNSIFKQVHIHYFSATTVRAIATLHAFDLIIVYNHFPDLCAPIYISLYRGSFIRYSNNTSKAQSIQIFTFRLISCHVFFALMPPKYIVHLIT